MWNVTSSPGLCGPRITSVTWTVSDQGLRSSLQRPSRGATTFTLPTIMDLDRSATRPRRLRASRRDSDRRPSLASLTRPRYVVSRSIASRWTSDVMALKSSSRVSSPSAVDLVSLASQTLPPPVGSHQPGRDEQTNTTTSDTAETADLRSKRVRRQAPPSRRTVSLPHDRGDCARTCDDTGSHLSRVMRHPPQCRHRKIHEAAAQGKTVMCSGECAAGR